MPNAWPGPLIVILFGYVFCSFVSYRYHRLMVRKYKNKRDKAVATKGWAAQEGWSVRETKRIMDIELFLEGQAKWEEDSPHQLVILYKMFRHALMRGRKKQSIWSAEATRRAFPSWTQRQTYPPSSLLAPKPPRKKSSPFTFKSTSSRGCQDPHLVNLS